MNFEQSSLGSEIPRGVEPVETAIIEASTDTKGILKMGYLFENVNDSNHNDSSNDSSDNKHVTFGKVQTFEYEKPEQKVSFKKRIQGIFENAMTIGNDENLKILIKNQNF